MINKILLLFTVLLISCQTSIKLDDNYSRYYIPSKALTDTVVYTYEYYYNDKLTKENYELFWIEKNGDEILLNQKILNHRKEPLLLWKMKIDKSGLWLKKNTYYDDISRNIMQTDSEIKDNEVFCWTDDCDSILTMQIQNEYKILKVDRAFPPKDEGSFSFNGNNYPAIGVLDYINITDFRDSINQNTVSIQKFAQDIGKFETIVKLTGDNFYFIKLVKIDLYEDWIRE